MCEETGLQPARCIAIGQQADHGIPVFVEYETHVVQEAVIEPWLYCLYLPYRNLLTCSLYSLIIESKKNCNIRNYSSKQECVPVGWVPTAAVTTTRCHY